MVNDIREIINIYCKNYTKKKYTRRKNVVFISTCHNTDSDYWSMDGEGDAAGSTYH
jgi:hypothetical protein